MVLNGIQIKVAIIIRDKVLEILGTIESCLALAFLLDKALKIFESFSKDFTVLGTVVRVLLIAFLFSGVLGINIFSDSSLLICSLYSFS